jgi:Thioesterase-like superfamily
MAATEDLCFDKATALRPATDPGIFETDLNPQWAVGDKPNGGYLLALLGRAARIVARERGGVGWEVQSSAITFVRPPELGTATVTTTLLRRGRSAAQVRAVLSQRGDDLVDAVFVLAALDVTPRTRYVGTAPFHAAEPAQCVRLPARLPGGLVVGINEVVELRLDPDTVPLTESPRSPGTPAELRGWTRFADGREPDALSLLFSADAIPPATMMIGSTGWVPTLQMSSYVRLHPAPGWLAIRMAANVVADGTVDETCVLWDSRGRVVAQSTQLARVRFPDEPD